MMPMPPTSSEIDATAASNSAMTWLLPSAALAIWLRLRTAKSLTSAGPDMVPAHQCRGDLLDRRSQPGSRSGPGRRSG